MNNKNSDNRHKFLLDYFFDDISDEYSVKKIKNSKWVLVKQYNSNKNEWQVAIYTDESYKKSQWVFENIIKK